MFLVSIVGQRPRAEPRAVHRDHAVVHGHGVRGIVLVPLADEAIALLNEADPRLGVRALAVVQVHAQAPQRAHLRCL